MNFLAHIALSGPREYVMMGNFTGDYPKGKLTANRFAVWPPDYLLGVKLHRFIDDFTDTHPTVLTAKRFLGQTHPKVAGVAIDIFFDYFLANRFAQFYGEDLGIFARRSYEIIFRHRNLIPSAMLPMAEAMVKHDWLTNYRTVGGIERACSGLARRYAFMSGIQGAELEMILNQSVYEAAFLEFYPELQKATEAFLAEN